MNEQQSLDNLYDEDWKKEELEYEQKVRERRARRLEQMKKEKARCIMIQNCIKIGVPIVTVVLIAIIVIAQIGKNSREDNSTSKEDNIQMAEVSSMQEEESNSNVKNDTDEQNSSNITNDVENKSEQNNENVHSGEGSLNGDRLNNPNIQTNTSNEIITENETQQIIYSAITTDNTKSLSSEIISTNALLIDLESGNILAQKDMKTVLSPASMTKVLTVLVAAEQIEKSQLDDTFTMTIDITDYAYVNDCSSVGFLVDEVVTVRDLFYGTILPSGGDAAVGLATYVAGSHEAFVELMNEKLEELGLADTAHVTNCVGLYDKEHHCTVYDMAMIMEAAMENELCREVMNARTYTTSPTKEHPDGITISNWFLRRIEDKDTGGEVLCAKTGYVAQSGSCAVSYAKDNGGKEYICVTANSTSSWKCIYDHVAIYKMFATGDPEEDNTSE